MKQQKLSGKERHNGKEPYTNAVTNTEQQVYNSCSRIEPQRTTPISRLQKQKRRNLRESSQQLSPRRYFSLLPEQKKQHFESSKHVEDYEYQRERQTQRERQRGKKKAYQEEKDSFLRRMIVTGRRLMLPSSLPGRRHSSCSPQSAISVSLANNNTRTQSTARDTERERERANPKSVFCSQV
jgi:hypothetical protein